MSHVFFNYFFSVCFMKGERKKGYGVGWMERWEDLGGSRRSWERGNYDENILHEKTFNKK